MSQEILHLDKFVYTSWELPSSQIMSVRSIDILSYRAKSLLRP